MASFWTLIWEKALHRASFLHFCGTSWAITWFSIWLTLILILTMSPSGRLGWDIVIWPWPPKELHFWAGSSNLVSLVPNQYVLDYLLMEQSLASFVFGHSNIVHAIISLYSNRIHYSRAFTLLPFSKQVKWTFQSSCHGHHYFWKEGQKYSLIHMICVTAPHRGSYY